MSNVVRAGVGVGEWGVVQNLGRGRDFNVTVNMKGYDYHSIVLIKQMLGLLCSA